MNFKRIGSTILAGAMAFSITSTAFAAGLADADRLAITKATEFEVEMEGQVYTPEIRVQVLSKGAKVYVNPTKGAIEGTITGFSEGTTAVPVGYKFSELGVGSTPIMIRSDSKGALDVNATVTVTAPRTVTLVETKPSSSDTGKKAYIQIAGTQSLTDKSSVAAMTETDFTGVSGTKNGVIKASGTAQTVQSVCQIAAAETTTGSGASATTTVTPQYGGIMLTGGCTNDTADPWGESDAISATMILTFAGGTRT